MSLAIKLGDSSTDKFGFIYLDAVTQYTRDFKGQVTSHPIGSGGLISDHFIRSNPSYQITGVISAADISLGMFKIENSDGQRPTNLNKEPALVKIKDGKRHGLINLIPKTVSQFFVSAESSVVVDSSYSRSSEISRIAEQFTELFSRDGLQLVTLYDHVGSKLNKVANNLIATSLSFQENAESGDALYLSISLEQVSFVDLEFTQLSKEQLAQFKKPKAVNVKSKEVAAQVTEVKDKGDTPPSTTPPASGTFGSDVAEAGVKAAGDWFPRIVNAGATK